MKIIKICHLIALFLILSPGHKVLAIGSDIVYDQTLQNDSIEDVSDEDYSAPDDTTLVKTIHFQDSVIQALKADTEMNYKQPPTVAESIWERIWKWFAELIAAIFDSALHTSWGKVIVFVLGFILIAILVMMMLKVNAFKVLFSGKGVQMQSNVIEENIHEMDFDSLIEKAIQQQNYRRGIRLLFLFALKLLSDKHLIRWESGKTNHEYVNELTAHDLKEGLNELSIFFDYAWYGNFKIEQSTFQKANSIFNQWRNKLR